MGDALDRIYRNFGLRDMAVVAVTGPPTPSSPGCSEVIDAGAELVMLNPLFDELEQIERLAAERRCRTSDRMLPCAQLDSSPSRGLPTARRSAGRCTRQGRVSDLVTSEEQQPPARRPAALVAEHRAVRRDRVPGVGRHAVRAVLRRLLPAAGEQPRRGRPTDVELDVPRAPASRPPCSSRRRSRWSPSDRAGERPGGGGRCGAGCS